MGMAIEYHDARRDEDLGRLRRVLALRAMVAVGMSQREIATALGISQPAVSQQLKAAPDVTSVNPEILLEAAAPIIRRVAVERGFSKLAVFGSVARHRARLDSDIDLLVQEPPGTTIRDMVRLQRLFQEILGRSVDLATYGGLKPGIHDDIRRDTVILSTFADDLASWRDALADTFAAAEELLAAESAPAGDKPESEQG